MPGTKSTNLINSQIDDMVANLDELALQNAGGSDIVVYSPVAWGAASAGRKNHTGVLSDNATADDTITQAEYRDSGASGESISGLLVDTPASAAWAATTAYSVNDKVISGGRHYKCKEAHTSSASGATGDEPGTGDGFRNYWDEINVRVNQVAVTNGQQVDVNSGFLEVSPDMY